MLVGEKPHPIIHFTRVLQDQASERLTAFEAREWLVSSCLTHGNAFALIERNGTRARSRHSNRWHRPR